MESANGKQSVHVRANGKAFVVDAETTVEAFIRLRQLDPRFVVVELNGEPLERKRYPDVRLREGDRLELVRAVAGG
jgi:thiamine biosynthesis protein ThiS